MNGYTLSMIVILSYINKLQVEVPFEHKQQYV
jgi:hypothetical protein